MGCRVGRRGGSIGPLRPGRGALRRASGCLFFGLLSELKLEELLRVKDRNAWSVIDLRFVALRKERRRNNKPNTNTTGSKSTGQEK